MDRERGVGVRRGGGGLEVVGVRRVGGGLEVVGGPEGGGGVWRWWGVRRVGGGYGSLRSIVSIHNTIQISLIIHTYNWMT